jgi:hypothetical protein
MELTVSEANAFWPVYQEYQAELGKLRHREVKLIEEFSANFGTIPDDAAKSLLDDSLSNIIFLLLDFQSWILCWVRISGGSA